MGLVRSLLQIRQTLGPGDVDVEVLDVDVDLAPLLVLHQQRLKVIPAVIPPLLAAEGGRKEGVEFLKAVVDPLEARRIHHSNHPTSSVQPSYQTTRRCSTSPSRGRKPAPSDGTDLLLPESTTIRPLAT